MVSLARKVAFLGDPASYGGRVAQVEARETHMSWVFLTQDRVYKLKKPVRYPYLDFSTQRRRHHFCGEEMRLNARLAARTYLDVVALRCTSSGALTLSGEGEAVDWLVVMRRLPEEEMLEARILDDRLTGEEVEQVASLLADFYAACPPQTEGGDAYLRHLRHEQEVNREVLERPELELAALAADALDKVDRALEAQLPAIERRIAAGLIVEGHGDLRPEHVCLDQPLQIIDRLDFNRSMRIIDPFDEVNYLGLECEMLGAAWVRPLLLDILERRLDHRPAPQLMALYGAFRCLLRARLSIAHLLETPIRKPEKWRPLALRYLEAAGRECLNLQSAKDRK